MKSRTYLIGILLLIGIARSFGLAIADVDGDNDSDIFITNYIGPSSLWLNNGSGVFTQNDKK